MGGGHVVDLGGHLINPLIDAVLGVLRLHGHERHGEIAKDGIVRVSLPGVGVPVVAQAAGVIVHGILLGGLHGLFRGGSGLLRGLLFGLGGFLSLGSFFRLGCFGGLLGAGHSQAKDHQQSQQDRYCLFHLLSSYVYFSPNEKLGSYSLFTNDGLHTASLTLHRDLKVAKIWPLYELPIIIPSVFPVVKPRSPKAPIYFRYFAPVPYLFLLLCKIIVFHAELDRLRPTVDGRLLW